MKRFPNVHETVKSNALELLEEQTKKGKKERACICGQIALRNLRKDGFHYLKLNPSHSNIWVQVKKGKKKKKIGDRENSFTNS